MRERCAMSWRYLIVAALLLAGAQVAGWTRFGAVQAQARGAGADAACAQAGSYQVGSRYMPMMENGQQTGSVGTIVGAPAGRPALFPLWALRGQLRITAYAGCGAATAGSFAVSRAPMGPPPMAPNGKQGKASAAIACRIPCWPATGIQSAMGSFTRDEEHANNPLYVKVSATITSTRQGPMMGRPCSDRDGCPPPSVITSTVTFSDVTGYLQVTGGAGMGTATLSFLVPPVGQDGAAPAAVTLQGWRGSGATPAPQPAPAP